jgi:predicted Zn-dependent peptidase
MLNRETAPAYREIDQIVIQKAESRKLENGIPVHLIKAGTEPVIRIEFIFQAGHWFEPYNGISYFTTKSLSLGTSGLTAKLIEEKIALYGAFLDLSTGYDRCTLTLYCLSKHLRYLLPLLKEMIMDSVFPGDEIENIKNISLQHYKVNLNKTSFLASAAFRKLLFGENHPYGRIINEEAVLHSDRGDILKFYAEKFGSENIDIVLSGNGDEDFYALINEAFGKCTWGKTYSAKEISNENIKENKILIEKKDSVQSSIRMGFPLFTISHPDYFKVSFLIELFGGYFGSRLMKNIREEKGYTYGIGASVHTLKNSGYVLISTDVNKENTENTIMEIYKEASFLKEKLVDEEELNTLKNYLLGSFVSSISTPFGLADKFKTIYFNDLDYSFYDRYISSTKEITSKEIREAANKYFPDGMLEVVAGGR